METFSPETANDLAVLLRAGSLPAPIEVLEERTVGPSLGIDSIESGKKSPNSWIYFGYNFYDFKI